MKTNRIHLRGTAKSKYPEGLHRCSCATVPALTLAALLAAAGSRGDILYVSTYQGNTIEKFDLATGTALGVFANTALTNPTFMAFDNTGNLYLANTGDRSILKFTPEGARSVFARTGQNPRTGKNYPHGLAFDSTGSLYVASYYSTGPWPWDEFSMIEKFTPDGVGSVFYGGDSYVLMGLAFDRAGNLYAANYRYVGSEVGIMKYTPSGVRSRFANSGLAYPVGLAFDSVGNLFAANQYTSHIEKFSPTGADLGGFATNGLDAPMGIAVDTADNFYVANQFGWIEKFTPDGVGSLFATPVGRIPYGIAIQVRGPALPTVICSPPLSLECKNGTAVGTVRAELGETNGYPLAVVWTVDGTPYQTNQVPPGGTFTASDVTFTASFAPGEHLVVVSASNGQTNATTCSTTVTVRDTTPPTIARVVGTPNVLWPPNRRMVPVSVSAEAVDDCDPSPVIRITQVLSNEPENPFAPDWEIKGPSSVDLRADRSGRGQGRIYTVVLECQDVSGNVSYASVEVMVPHASK